MPTALIESSQRGQPSEQQKNSRQNVSLIVVSGAVALLGHIVFLLMLPPAWQKNQSTDYSAYYEPVAQNLASGGGLYLGSKPALVYPCGIPIMYAATFRVANALHITKTMALRILEAFFLTLTSIMVSLLALSILSWRTALIASVLWSTYPFHLWLTKQPDATSAFTLLLLLGAFFTVGWLDEGRHSEKYGAVVGVALGLAALIKPIAIALPVVVVGAACFCTVPCKRRHRARFAFGVIVAYLLLLSPWELWANKVSGQWIPLGTNGPNVLIDGLTFGTVRGVKSVWLPAKVQSLTEEAVAHYHELKTTRSLAKFIFRKAKEEPGALAELFLIKAGRSWYGSESHAFEEVVLLVQMVYVPFVILGARELWRHDRRQRSFLLLVTGITLYFWSVTTLTALPDLRYLVPTVSLTMIVAAVALDTAVAHALAAWTRPTKNV
jgi:Dolichyl-phosphate-mannose-protein mannosyltransferase